MAHPEERTDISPERDGPDRFLPWVITHRGDISAAVLTIITAWMAAGCPEDEVRKLGSFNVWAQTAGAILAFAEVSDFLGNIEQIRADSDEETAEWEPFLRAIVSVRGVDADQSEAPGEQRSTPFRAAEIATTFTNHDDPYLAELLPDLGSDGRGDSGDIIEYLNRLKKRLGRALKRKVGTRYGPFNLRIERAGQDGHSGQPLYVVAGDLRGLLTQVEITRKESATQTED
jgi:hypothetical protein